MEKKNNELRLLIILACLLVCVVSYNWALKPLKATCDTLELQVNTEDALIRTMYARTLSYDNNYERYKAACKELGTMSENYYTGADQEEYLEKVFDMLGDAEFHAADSEISDEILLFAEETAEEGEFSLEVSGIDMTVEAEGLFEGFKSYIGQVADSPKMIVFRNLKLDQTGEEDGEKLWKMSSILNFYSIDNIIALSKEADNAEPLEDYQVPADFLDMSYRRGSARTGYVGGSFQEKLSEMIMLLKSSVNKKI